MRCSTAAQTICNALARSIHPYIKETRRCNQNAPSPPQAPAIVKSTVAVSRERFHASVSYFQTPLFPSSSTIYFEVLVRVLPSATFWTRSCRGHRCLPLFPPRVRAFIVIAHWAHSAFPLLHFLCLSFASNCASSALARSGYQFVRKSPLLGSNLRPR